MHTFKPAIAALAVAALAAVLVTGCETVDPYTGEKKTSDTTYGALIGAGAGGLSGAAVGAYMDKQEAELREQMRQSGVSVTRKGDDIILNMPGNVTFRSGSADLNPQFFKVLDGVAQVAKKYDKTIIEVAGHTDNVGGADYNRQLSQRRAGSVAQYLESRGVSEQRIMTAGGGEDHPIASNSTDQGRAANRRVEVTLAPLKAG